MTPDLMDLGRRLMALPDFEWMPGMLSVDGERYLRRRPGAEYPHLFFDPMYDAVIDYSDAQLKHIEPEPADPATLGCLLALVREKWGRPNMAATPEIIGVRVLWYVEDFTDGSESSLGLVGDTEAEALVCALEAIPC